MIIARLRLLLITTCPFVLIISACTSSHDRLMQISQGEILLQGLQPSIGPVATCPSNAPSTLLPRLVASLSSANPPQISWALNTLNITSFSSRGDELQLTGQCEQLLPPLAQLLREAVAARAATADDLGENVDWQQQQQQQPQEQKDGGREEEDVTCPYDQSSWSDMDVPFLNRTGVDGWGGRSSSSSSGTGGGSGGQSPWWWQFDHELLAPPSTYSQRLTLAVAASNVLLNMSARSSTLPVMGGSVEVIGVVGEVLGAAREQQENPGLQELALNLMELVARVGPHIGAGERGVILQGQQQQKKMEEEEDKSGQEQQQQKESGSQMQVGIHRFGDKAGDGEWHVATAAAAGTGAGAGPAAQAVAVGGTGLSCSSPLQELATAAPLHGPLLLQLMCWLDPSSPYSSPHLRLLSAAAAAWHGVAQGLRAHGGEEGWRLLAGVWRDSSQGLVAATETLLSTDRRDAEVAVEGELEGELGFSGVHVGGGSLSGVVTGGNGGVTGVQLELLVLWRQVTAVTAGVRLLGGLLHLHMQQMTAKQQLEVRQAEQQQHGEHGQQGQDSVLSVLVDHPQLVRRVVAVALGRWPAAAAGIAAAAGGAEGGSGQFLQSASMAAAGTGCSRSPHVDGSGSSNGVLQPGGVHRAVASISTRHPLWGYLVEQLHQLVVWGLRVCRSLGASSALGRGLLMRHKEQMLGALLEGGGSSGMLGEREAQVFGELLGVLQVLQASKWHWFSACSDVF